MKIIPIIVAIILAGWGTLGDSFIKISANSVKFDQIKFFLLGMSVYSISAFGWFYVIKYLKLSSVGFIYSVSTALLLVLIGTFYFKETIGTREALGIATSILSLALLTKFN